MENYQFNETELVIQDSELQLDIKVEFRPVLIPKNPVPGQYVQTHTIQMDLSGGFYLEKDQVRDGQALLLYPDGKSKMECYYLKGFLHGPSSFFSETGQLLAKSWFYEGKQEGKSFWYYPSGQLYSIQRYRRGQWHLLQEYYYKSGKLKSSIHYQNGHLDGEVRLYFSDGTLKRTRQFSQGKKLD